MPGPPLAVLVVALVRLVENMKAQQVSVLFVLHQSLFEERTCSWLVYIFWDEVLAFLALFKFRWVLTGQGHTNCPTWPLLLLTAGSSSDAELLPSTSDMAGVEVVDEPSESDSSTPPGALAPSGTSAASELAAIVVESQAGEA